MNKSVLCLFILIIGLALGMGAACASESIDTPASVGESSMEVENAGALSSSGDSALEESSSESEENFKSSNDPLDSKLSAPQNNPSLTANEEGNFTELQELIDANYDGTLVLNKSYSFNQGFNPRGISITGSITIDGNNNVLDGKNLARIFYITGANVILKNIQFINGNFFNSDGGAVYWSGDNGNLSDSIFINNTAAHGGAVYWSGDNGVLTGSSFVNNSVLGSNYPDGGAIYWKGANGTVSGSTFRDNFAARYGGAVFWAGVEGTLDDSVFINNSADNLAGAVFWHGVNGTVTGSTFSGNNASYGGVVYWFGVNGTVTGSTFEDNFVSKNGGAVLWAGVNGTLSDSSFVNNSALIDYYSDGGAVYWSGDNGTVTGSTFRDNFAVRFGGAVFWAGVESTLDDSIFINNFAGSNGGAVLWHGVNGTLSRSNFTDNSVDSLGGAVYWFGVNGTLTGSNFIDNNASYGGALSWFGDDGVLNDSYFIGNNASYGGAVYWWDAVNGTLKDSSFINNSASYGGAVYFTELNSNNVVTGSNFINNSAISGGAIFWTGLEGTVTGSTFINNTDEMYGCDIFVDGIRYPKYTIVDSVFYGASEEYRSIRVVQGEVNLTRNNIRGSVTNKGTLYLDTNTVAGFIINGGTIATLTVATLLDNKTVFTKSSDVRVYGTLVDDNGNSICDESFTITVNGVAIRNVKYDNDERLYVAEYILETPGLNVVNSTYDATVVKTGILELLEVNITEFTVVVGQSNNIIHYGEDAPVYVTLLGTDGVGLNETVTVIVNNKPYSVTVENGRGSFNLSGLAPGRYSALGIFLEKNLYFSAYATCMFSVLESGHNLTVDVDNIKVGEVATITVTVPDDAEGIVLVDLGVAKSYGEINGGKAVINISGLSSGKYTVNALFEGDSKYDEASGTGSFEVIKETYAIKVTMIDGLKLTGVLTDDNGKPVSNALVSYNLNNGEAVNVTTNDKGEFVCDVESNSVLTMSYAKDDEVLCNASITLKNINPNRQSTWIDVPANMQMTASDFKKGEAGQIFAFYLRDANGNGLANKVIKIGIFDKKYTVKTDATGRAELPIRIENANYYTYAPAFLGDKDYEASLSVCSLKIVKKSTTITPAKTSYSFASSAKTKTVTATLKSTNSFIPNGKQATLTIAGKTFKTTIGDKGQINFNIGSITLKGTYKVQIKFAGTNTYAASNSQTITIKIA